MQNTINAKVVKNFNDTHNDLHFYDAEDDKNNIIMNMPIDRFEDLKAKGYVEEYKEPKKKQKEDKNVEIAEEVIETVDNEE